MASAGYEHRARRRQEANPQDARASYEAVEESLRRMREQADAEGVGRIAIPRVGVGHGGLSWRKVRAIVETVFGDWPGTLVVYEEYAPKGGRKAPDVKR